MISVIVFTADCRVINYQRGMVMTGLNMLHPECEEMRGRRRAICRGEANIPLNGRNSINSYRQSMGLPPLKSDERATPVVNADCRNGCPGTELKLLLESLGIKAKSTCQCNARVAQMNRLGVQAIRNDKSTWIGYMTEAYHLSSWLEIAMAATLAVVYRYPKSIEGLLDEALRRAEEKAMIGTTNS